MGDGAAGNGRHDSAIPLPNLLGCLRQYTLRTFVADAVAVGILPFGWIERERIQGVGELIIVVICVAGVAQCIAIGIGLIGVCGERTVVRAVQNAVAVIIGIRVVAGAVTVRIE